MTALRHRTRAGVSDRTTLKAGGRDELLERLDAEAELISRGPSAGLDARIVDSATRAYRRVDWSAWHEHAPADPEAWVRESLRSLVLQHVAHRGAQLGTAHTESNFAAVQKVITEAARIWVSSNTRWIPDAVVQCLETQLQGLGWSKREIDRQRDALLLTVRRQRDEVREDDRAQQSSVQPARPSSSPGLALHSRWVGVDERIQAEPALQDRLEAPVFDDQARPTGATVARANAHAAVNLTAAQLLASETYRQRLGMAGRHPIDDDVLAALVTVLEAGGGRAHRDRLAAAAGVHAAAFSGVLAAVRRVLNVNSYSVVKVDADGVIVLLDVALLREQFELGGE